MFKYNDTTWINYTTTDGLADNFVRCVTIDANGIKWFGTDSGACCFDDSTWTTYTTDDSLADNKVYSIAIDENGVKWFGTAGGVSRFDDTSWTSYTTDDGLLANRVYAIGFDQNGDKWFGSSGLVKFDGDTIVTLLSSYFIVSSITTDEHGNMWVGTTAGVQKFDTAEVRTSYTIADGLKDNFVEAICVDKNDYKWFGTMEGGISRFIEGTGVVAANDILYDVIEISALPNPFSNGLRISSNSQSQLSVSIYNIHGSFVNRIENTGDVIWNCRDSHNAIAPDGMYIFHVFCGDDKYILSSLKRGRG